MPDFSSAALWPMPGRDRLVQLDGETMGTTWSARFYASPSEGASLIRQDIQAALNQVVDEMSPWLATSAISRFNAAPAGSWHTLPSNFFFVLETALDIAKDTNGAFDPTLGRVVDAWGFGPGGERAQDPSAIAPPSPSGWARIEVDHERHRVRQPGGLALDLCGIAKGFGVDQVARALRKLGIRDFLIEVGGELRGEGVKPDGTPWWVALEDPPMSDDAPSRASDIMVALHACSIATSGDYRRYVRHNGRRYAHTIDPRSGQPLDNAVAAVTVLDASCMRADALATAMMVMGRTAALEFATRRRIAARMVLRTAQGMSEMLTPAFERLLDDGS